MNGRGRYKNEAVSLILLTAFAGITGVVGYLSEDAIPETNRSRLYMPNRGGAVLFEHEAHIPRAESCQTCHHDALSANSLRACSVCHGELYEDEAFGHDDLKEILEHTCDTCHLIKQSAPIQSCRICHPVVQEANERILPCSECHDETYTGDMLTHDEMQDIEAHDCDSCHVARAVGDIHHAACNRCHLRTDPEKFSDAQGKPLCYMCHLK